MLPTACAQAEQRPDEFHINGFQRQLREAPGPSLHTHPTAAGAEDALAADVERERGRERESASERPAEEEEEEDVWHTPQRVSSESVKGGEVTLWGGGGRDALLTRCGRSSESEAEVWHTPRDYTDQTPPRQPSAQEPLDACRVRASESERANGRPTGAADIHICGAVGEGSEALKHGDMTVLGAQLELDELATTLLMLPPALSPICVADKHEVRTLVCASVCVRASVCVLPV